MTDESSASTALASVASGKSSGKPVLIELVELNYGLMKLGSNLFVPISKDAFEKITVARDCLMQLVLIEEKFDFVIENLAALEKELLEAASLCKTPPMETVEFQVSKSDINRHVANLVAIGRMYIEQSLVHAEKLNVLAGRALFDLAGARRTQYDARLGYQLFEELRNYMLHRGAAVHYAEYFTAKEYDTEGVMRLRHKVSIYTSAAQLAEDRKFKKRVSARLEAIGDHHDLIAMARDYVAGLWDAQLEYRSALADFISDTEAAYRVGAYLYAESEVGEGSPNEVALAAVGRATDGSIKKKTAIVFDLIAQREHYELKNGEKARRNFI